ncbi:MAG: hypothetical protein U1E98_02745 [Moraxella osloensis]
MSEIQFNSSKKAENAEPRPHEQQLEALAQKTLLFTKSKPKTSLPIARLQDNSALNCLQNQCVGKHLLKKHRAVNT